MKQVVAIQPFILIFNKFFWLMFQVGVDEWDQFSTIVWAREVARDFSKLWRDASRLFLILRVIQWPELFAS